MPADASTLQRLPKRAQKLRALGHPARLLILALLQRAPRHGEELAAILALSPSTIAHHLLDLQRAGWIESQQVQYYQRYSLKSKALSIRLTDLLDVSTEELRGHVDLHAYERGVLQEAFSGERLLELPRAQVKRDIVLRQIASLLDENRLYTSLQMDRILVEICGDVSQLRGALLDDGWITATERGFQKRAQPRSPKG